jgi:hypothetical protein
MKKMYKLLSAAVVLLSLANTSKAQNYCIPSVSSPAGDDEIAYVTFATMSNTTTCSTPASGPGSIGGGYSNFTGSLGIPNLAGSVPAPNVVMGNSYPLAVGLTMCSGFAYSGIIGTFIDYNQDGNFTGTGENIWNSTYPSTGGVSPAFVIFNAPNITIPFTATPGLTRLRVWDSETSVMSGPCGNITWGEVEDYVINIVPPTPCSGTPASNTVVATQTLVCPVFGTSVLQPANVYTLGGITYSWQSSTGSILGPYTNIPGANSYAYTTPTLNATTYYQVAVGCANGGATIAAQPITIQVAATTTNSVPYFEGFENITQNGQLPNCSWTRTNAYQNTTRTASVSAVRQARTGNKFGEFDASDFVYYNIRSYYSNGIQLYSGITYSASVWYKTPGYPTWFNFSLLIGPNQSNTGQMNLGTVSSPNNSSYQPLSSTFTVATSGLYYLCVRAQENYYGSQLVWDDLAITAPCSFTNNGASITVTGPTQICAGQTANFTATGAGTYSWNTGAPTNTLAVSPAFNTTYFITGTNPLTGCFSTLAKPLQVNQLPPVSVVAFKSDVCVGGSLNMFATSAISYTWSTGTQAAAVSVTPAATTIYTVLGSDAYGCVGTATQQIVVNPLPVITIVPPSKTICKGEPANLTASGAAGATTYMWTSNESFLQAVTVSAYPQTTTTYTVSGTDANGCTGTANIVVTVDACVGIATVGGSSTKAAIFPNPNNGDFTVELINNLPKTIEVMDVRGRVVLSSTSDNNLVKVNISTLANGVYYVKVKSANTVEVLKVVKQ